MHRRGGVAIAGVMLLVSCASGDVAPEALEAVVPVADARRTEVSVTPPPPPVPDDPAYVVVVVDTTSSAGLDAVVQAIGQRPDLRVDVVTGPAIDRAPVSAALAEVPEADVVVRAISQRGPGPEAVEDALAHGVSLVSVRAEDAPVVDYAAATLELLSLLDLLLADLATDAHAVQLAVPSCEHGTVRGRIEVADAPLEGIRSDCVGAVAEQPRDAAQALGAGYVAISTLG